MRSVRRKMQPNIQVTGVSENLCAGAAAGKKAADIDRPAHTSYICQAPTSYHSKDMDHNQSHTLRNYMGHHTEKSSA